MAQVKSSEQKPWILRCPLRPFRLKESSVFNNSIWVKNSWNLIHLRLTSHVEIVQNRCRNDLKQKKRLSMRRIWFKEQKKCAHSLNIQPAVDSRIAGHIGTPPRISPPGWLASTTSKLSSKRTQSTRAFLTSFIMWDGVGSPSVYVLLLMVSE